MHATSGAVESIYWKGVRAKGVSIKGREWGEYFGKGGDKGTVSGRVRRWFWVVG